PVVMAYLVAGCGGSRMENKNQRLLDVTGVCKNFGALRASDDVNITLKEGEVHALIGPNGAGKSTLIAQLCGELLPDSGQIVFDGDDITRMPAYKRARLGLARSFQITELCLDYTTLEN